MAHGCVNSRLRNSKLRRRKCTMPLPISLISSFITRQTPPLLITAEVSTQSNLSPIPTSTTLCHFKSSSTSNEKAWAADASPDIANEIFPCAIQQLPINMQYDSSPINLDSQRRHGFKIKGEPRNNNLMLKSTQTDVIVCGALQDRTVDEQDMTCGSPSQSNLQDLDSLAPCTFDVAMTIACFGSEHRWVVVRWTAMRMMIPRRREYMTHPFP